MKPRDIPGPKSLTLALLALLCACAPAVQLQSTVAASSPSAVTPTSLPTALLTIKIVTYNILVGGGRDRALDEHTPEKFRGRDRTPLLMEYLEQLDADIVGLQETTGWDQGSPAYIEEVADRLGMNYVVSTGRSDSSLLTKFEILEAEDLSNEVNSIVRARLRGPDGEPINVFVAHLNSGSQEDRACGTQFLLRATQPYMNQRTFLIGDLNFRTNAAAEWSPGALRSNGWKFVAMEPRLGIDHIWAPESLVWEDTGWTASIGNDLGKISDHQPLGREVRIYSPSGDLLSKPLPEPTAMQTVEGLPPAIAEVAANVRVAFTEQLGRACNEERWNPDMSSAHYSDGVLRVYGKEGWQAGANWSMYISEGAGMMVDFKFDPLSEFNIFLEHGSWASPEFRKFGPIVGSDGSLHVDMWEGETPLGGDRWEGISEPKPDTWYRLLLLADEDARLTGFVWEIEDPSRIAVYEREMGASWAGLTWRLSTGANKGSSYIAAVTHVTFDGVEQP